jgi:hypothetical protein
VCARWLAGNRSNYREDRIVLLEEAQELELCRRGADDEDALRTFELVSERAKKVVGVVRVVALCGGRVLWVPMHRVTRRTERQLVGVVSVDEDEARLVVIEPDGCVVVGRHWVGSPS